MLCLDGGGIPTIGMLSSFKGYWLFLCEHIPSWGIFGSFGSFSEFLVGFLI